MRKRKKQVRFDDGCGFALAIAKYIYTDGGLGPPYKTVVGDKVNGCKEVYGDTFMTQRGAEAIYTIGHSNHRIKDFIGLLKKNGITAIADVRSSPFSKHNPQFNRDVLTDALKNEGIAYVFLGLELGARPDDPICYDNGLANFSKMAERPIFNQGIERLLRGMEKYRLALLCAEKEPLDCHRTILVCRYLSKLGLPIKHILADGRSEDHQVIEHRLVKNLGLGPNLFNSNITDADRVEEAYNQRAREIACKREGEEENHEHAR